jgi:hypothetical protein
LDGQSQKSFLINNRDQNYYHVINLKSQSQQLAQISQSFNKNIKKKMKNKNKNFVRGIVRLSILIASHWKA